MALRSNCTCFLRDAASSLGDSLLGMWDLDWRLGTRFLDMTLQHMASRSSHQPEQQQHPHCSFYALCLSHAVRDTCHT